MTVYAIDLFCGAGGLSTGLALACERHDVDVQLVAVNHWGPAIETHKRNHPDAEHYNAKVEAIEPRSVVDDGSEVRLLAGGPQCTHFSTARGGKPVDEQKRASPWHVLDWVAKLQPENVLLENVPEFESWGPVLDGEPTRNGQFFEAWIETFRGLGYSVAWRTLNTADYGDPTSRKRLFIVARKDLQPEWPEPTHHRDGAGDREPWRPAADIVNWSDRGESIWARDRPLVENTMARIADGIQRHADDALAPFAEVIADLGAEDVAAMQDDLVPIGEVSDAVKQRDEPFLVGPSGSEPVAADGGTVAGGSADDGRPTDDRALCVPFLLGQHGGSVARAVDEQPCQTVATRGAIQLIEPETFVLPRNGRARGLHSNPAYDPDERPLHVVTASNHDGHLVTSEPFLVTYNGQSTSESVRDPLPTVTTRDRFGLVVPELHPLGLDVRFRMLEPPELARAQGFPDDYDFAGSTKAEITEQIGNAVPVHTAQALCETLITGRDPTLDAFGGDGTEGSA